MIRHILIWIINQIVFSDSAVFDKVSTAIRNYGRHAQRNIKMPRILSHSATAWNNYIPAFLTVILSGDACEIFCLLPVGMCIDAYMMIGSYVLCVSTY